MYLGMPPHPFHGAPGRVHLSPGDRIDMGDSPAVLALSDGINPSADL